MSDVHWQQTTTLNAWTCQRTNLEHFRKKQGKQGEGEVWQRHKRHSQDSVPNLQQTWTENVGITRTRASHPRSKAKAKMPRTKTPTTSTPQPFKLEWHRCEMLELERNWPSCERLSQEETELVSRPRHSERHNDGDKHFSTCKLEWILLERLATSRVEQSPAEHFSHLGYWNRQWRSWVSCSLWCSAWMSPRSRHGKWTHLHVIDGERVKNEGKQQILGSLDGQTRDLNIRVARVRKSLTKVYDHASMATTPPS